MNSSHPIIFEKVSTVYLSKKIVEYIWMERKSDKGKKLYVSMQYAWLQSVTLSLPERYLFTAGLLHTDRLNFSEGQCNHFYLRLPYHTSSTDKSNDKDF